MNKNFFGRNARVLVFSLSVVLPVLFSGCGKSDFSPVSTDGKSQVSVTSIRIREGNSLALNPGRKSRLTVEVLPDDASDKSVSWSSDNEGIATVADGLVTGVALGEATITVSTKDGSYTATLKVTVTGDPSASISVTGVKINQGDALSLNTGQKRQLTVEISPSNADDTGVSWSSDNEGIATVIDGLVSGMSPGEATITVSTKDGGHTRALKVTVTADPNAKVAVTGVKIKEGGSLALNPNGEKQLTAEVSPRDATNQYIEWSSSDPGVVTVDGDGKVTAVSLGKATVTVTASDGSGQAATIEIEVTDYTLISTEQELRDIAKDLTGKYRLTGDITLTKEWEPLGTFTGTIDGGGHSIKNFVINKPSTNDVGLVSINNGTIQNIGIEIGAGNIYGKGRVGALAGSNNGTLSGVVSGQGSINGGEKIDGLAIGGLAGENNGGTLIGVALVDINSDAAYIGGLVGRNTGNVVGYTTGKINVRLETYYGYYVGGVVGFSSNTGALAGYHTGRAVTGRTFTAGVVGEIRSNNFSGYARSAVVFSGRADTNFRVVGSQAPFSASYYSETESTVTKDKDFKNGKGITIDGSKTGPETDYFDNLPFGKAVGEWTFHAGKWPSINFPEDQSIFDPYRGEKQPIEP